MTYLITFAIPASIILLCVGVLGYVAETALGKTLVAHILELLDV